MMNFNEIRKYNELATKANGDSINNDVKLGQAIYECRNKWTEQGEGKISQFYVEVEGSTGVKVSRAKKKELMFRMHDEWSGYLMGCWLTQEACRFIASKKVTSNDRYLSYLKQELLINKEVGGVIEGDELKKAYRQFETAPTPNEGEEEPTPPIEEEELYLTTLDYLNKIEEVVADTPHNDIEECKRRLLELFNRLKQF